MLLLSDFVHIEIWPGGGVAYVARASGYFVCRVVFLFDVSHRPSGQGFEFGLLYPRGAGRTFSWALRAREDGHSLGTHKLDARRISPNA